MPRAERIISSGKIALYWIVLLTLRILNWSFLVVRWMCVFLPVYIGFHLAVKFTIGTFNEDATGIDYHLMFAVVGLAAAMCGLTLRMVVTKKDTDEGKVYLRAGENLFSGTLLFVLALGVRYAYTHFSGGQEWLTTFTQLPLHISGVLAFYLALLFMGRALFQLAWDLARREEGPIYDIFTHPQKRIVTLLKQLQERKTQASG